jgi:Fe-S-cluster-containing hydrogenase component 2
MVCTEYHEKNYGLKTSRIRVVRIGDTIRIAMACRLCEKAPCVASCPRDALRQDEETGVIIVDEEKCNGCGWCFVACDLGLIFFHPTRKVPLMCDLCGGDEPLCVKACQKEALELTTSDAFSSKVREMAVNDLKRALEAAEKAK